MVGTVNFQQNRFVKKFVYNVCVLEHLKSLISGKVLLPYFMHSADNAECFDIEYVCSVRH